jgi:hypothetical protein
MVTPGIINELRKINPVSQHICEGRPDFELAMYFGIIVAVNMDDQRNFVPIRIRAITRKINKQRRRSRKSYTEKSNADPVEIEHRNLHIIPARTFDELLRKRCKKRTDKPDCSRCREKHLVPAEASRKGSVVNNKTAYNSSSNAPEKYSADN